jgi:PBP1b-binding outer membrane lipoprotein LpoB
MKKLLTILSLSTMLITSCATAPEEVTPEEVTTEVLVDTFSVTTVDSASFVPAGLEE